MSGGDGAPGWTLEAAGLDVTRFSEIGRGHRPRRAWRPLPAHDLADQLYQAGLRDHVQPLFRGERLSRPRTTVEGEPVQEFLQRHYIDAIKQVAIRLKGICQCRRLRHPERAVARLHRLVRPDGDTEACCALGNRPRRSRPWYWAPVSRKRSRSGVRGLRGIRPTGRALANPGGARAWRDGVDCLWRENGVWDLGDDGQPRLLRPDHFARVDGRAVDFAERLSPAFPRALRPRDPRGGPRRHPLSRGPAPAGPAPLGSGEHSPDVVHAAHWYDGMTIFMKRYLPFLGVDFDTAKFVLGRKRVRRSFVEQVARLKAESSERLGGVPTLVGEFGIPFDLQGGRAYRTGDFSQQVQAMDDTFQALEANLLSGTLWNYTADNDNRWGDQWNDEDLSIFSRDQQTDPDDINSGGRALEAAVRPYAHKVAGEPLEMAFEQAERFHLPFPRSCGRGPDRDLCAQPPISGRLPGRGLGRRGPDRPGGPGAMLPPRRRPGGAPDPRLSCGGPLLNRSKGRFEAMHRLGLFAVAAILLGLLCTCGAPGLAQPRPQHLRRQQQRPRRLYPATALARCR